MSAVLAGTSTELGTLRSRLATALTAGADVVNLSNEVLNVIDIVGRAMQATHAYMEESQTCRECADDRLAQHIHCITSVRQCNDQRISACSAK